MNAIEVQGITKHYTTRRMDNISFTVEQGYITGLIGPNGAGKSTLLRMLLHIVKPQQGAVKLLGMEMPHRERDIKRQVGYISDESHFYHQLRMDEIKRIVAPFYPNWDEGLYKRLMDRFGLSGKQKVGQVSKGMKMKFAIVMALSHHPRLLLMDEPTAGLDPVFRRELLELLLEWMEQGDRTILYSTHVTTDLDRAADYVLFLHEGQVLFHREKDQLFDTYAIVKGDSRLLDDDVRRMFIGIRETEVGFEGLVRERAEAMEAFGKEASFERPSLEDIMFYSTRTQSGGIFS
ncbi:ABC transporter ATP-binding protein [Paenibacillus thiaminolyticus]|uniref:ABC transporter ATP-binding protein n=1 Tax=Paenibacillus thiaminolyticus TaxID=49283 RepID=A0AAP9DVK6_PANTH|nr:ABC transporter ATP-binding protein [Paenibacillus thiaminolyticus]MCY9535408.1 ABC transporter ATP-binding protein [Paenibacillus thiaminolyticus]MCY9604830.1 ABC transporter ATP-binding protein [Paenibacillus thiaminolyticus]MCY9610017.1 ABC transporter ATP-binding protein [Paenibacillus thiaminolyticus]MCY9615144.1 ABC transporter ATP-binding protein [Paenibacillus thiaminolyticus]MCY9621137.1 ABC transporter ATP-binding protein [Paenibacillus thiaminolyticus]